MALRFSSAMQNFIAENGSWKDAMDNGSIEIYTGTQPATPDLAPTGTLLVTLTSSAGAKTNEVRPVGVVTLAGGTTTGDDVTALTIKTVDVLGGTVAWNSSLTQTATDCALAINRNPKNKWVVATSSGAVITLTGLPGVGALLNSAALACTGAGSMSPTITSTTFGSSTGGGVVGVDAINGLRIDYNAAAGVVTKDVTQTWSGTAVGAGTQTAGWFRFKGAVVDAGALDNATPPVFLRFDGAIATSGSQMNMSSTSITNGALQTLSTFSFTVPAA
ncbi:MAG: hypothetical protein PHW66_09620 [Gallionella sp.]|nr:hypothetical protein [Gallionella sp.]